MIKIILTLILVCLFLFSGRIIDAFKKFIKLITPLILKLLNFFGIKISKKEKTWKMSQEFKNVYKEIKIVKISKKNIKEISSIQWIYFIIMITTIILVVLNLNIISGNGITNWLYYNIIQKIPLLNKLTKNAIDANTLYTATMFSIISFVATKILQRWKETKQQRLEKKKNKLKFAVLELMSSKELLDQARKKDEDKYNELKG